MSNENENAADFQWTEVTDSTQLDIPVYDADFVSATDTGSDLDVNVEPIDVSAMEVADQAQFEADQAVAQGDYETAAELRETAEVAAEVAGDTSTLHGPNSDQLETADQHQDNAFQAQVEQAQHIHEGDYEAARDDALEAAMEHQTADDLAGGPNHAEQAMDDYQNLNDAVWNEQAADSFAADAIYYEEQGSEAAADAAWDNATDYQASADQLAGQSDPSTGYETDLYPEVEPYQPDPGLDDFDTTYDV